MDTTLKILKPYTFVSITWMGTTLRTEAIITGYQPQLKRHYYRIPGNGKIVPLAQEELDKMLVFEGHRVPFQTDCEAKCFHGNGRFNFVTDDPESLKAYIRQCCLNPCPEKLKKIVYHLPTTLDRGEQRGLPLFPMGQ